YHEGNIAAGVTAQHGPAVENLAINELLSQPGAAEGVHRGLVPAQLDVFGWLANSVTVQPAASRQPQDWNVAGEAFVQGLGADLDAAEDGELGNVEEAKARQLLLFEGDLQPAAAHPHERARFGYIDRPLIGVARNQPPRRRLAAGQQGIGL